MVTIKKRRDALALRGFNGSRIIERVADKTFLSENELLDVDDNTVIDFLLSNSNPEDVATLDDKARITEYLIIRVRAFMKRIERHIKRLLRLRSKLRANGDGGEQVRRIDTILTAYQFGVLEGSKAFASRLMLVQLQINKVAAATNFNTFGQRLRQSRQELNLTSVDISLKTGIDPNALTSYERNQRQPPLPILLVLSRVLRKSPNWLLAGVEN